MDTLKIGSLLLVAGILALAPTEGRAAASARYTLTDLGQTSLNNVAPSDFHYSAPQVDDAGIVQFGFGRTESSSYSSKTVNTTVPPNGLFPAGTSGQEIQYSGPGLPSAIIYPPSSLPSNYEFTYAGALNASGTAVGWSDPLNYFGMDNAGNPINHVAFVIHPGAAGRAPTISVIPGATPGTTASYALGINAYGMIVGQLPPGSGVGSGLDFGIGRAMISDGTTTVDLNTLIAPGSGVTLQSATSINDLGQIAGMAYDANAHRGFVYLLTPTPTPEPGAWAVAVTALVYAGRRRFANRRKNLPPPCTAA